MNEELSNITQRLDALEREVSELAGLVRDNVAMREPGTEQALKMKELEDTVSDMSATIDELRQDVQDSADYTPPPVSKQDKVFDMSALRPFDIQYDPTDEKWEIFLPHGCVRVGKDVATYEDGTTSDGWAEVEPAGTIYCHVSEDDDEWTFSLDKKSTKEGAEYNFPIAEFTDDKAEVDVQHVNDTVILCGAEEYIHGDDTSIVFTPVTSGDDAGKTKVDVYYS